MLLSKSQKKKDAKSAKKITSFQPQDTKNEFKNYIDKKDFSGAIAMLESRRRNGDNDEMTTLWIAYCLTHLGNFKKALKEYKQISKKGGGKYATSIEVYKSVCYFVLGMYDEAKETAEKIKDKCVSDVDLKLVTRVLFHTSHKLDEEDKLFAYHGQLEDTLENQLSLASIHYMRTHYQEAIDLYKKLLKDNR